MMPHQPNGPDRKGDLPEPPHRGSAGRKSNDGTAFHTSGFVDGMTVESLAGMMGMGREYPAPEPKSEAPEHVTDKVNLNLIPVDAKWLVAQVFEHGADKHAPFGWEDPALTIEEQLQAIERHLDRRKAGEMTDSESGLPHLAHLAARALIAVAKERRGHLSGHVQGCGLPERAA